MRVHIWLIAAAAVAGAGAACNRGRDKGSETTTTSTAGGDAALPMTPGAESALADARIFGVLSELNMGEIQAAKLAVDKAASAPVKSFARSMISDHAKMLNKGDSLATALQITPQPPRSDSVAAHGQSEHASLDAAAPGAAFDKVYMDAQVQDHQETLALLQQLEGQTQNAQVKSLLDGAIPIVQGHLARAKRIDRQVAGATPTQS